MDDREQRGLVIAATKPIRQRGVNWYVPSATGNGTYKVEPEPDRTIGAADFRNSPGVINEIPQLMNR